MAALSFTKQIVKDTEVWVSNVITPTKDFCVEVIVGSNRGFKFAVEQSISEQVWDEFFNIYKVDSCIRTINGVVGNGEKYRIVCSVQPTSGSYV